MDELLQARDIAIGLGGKITDNTVGFIACFDAESIAESYVISLEDLESLAAQQQEKCVVVVMVSSLL
ncbi:hypothetical protein [Leptothoe spongobia]|uniref:Uncharacterized protein n=1 Tax=Leptothoe spongobia TAU-MAC 1115 TaxID=1967444 RepID=A0A947GQ77_9CYAN|nr:hypothetical protein [Leptothoe spongobia]MBT9316931.1 hypothetical protein [Leptothoe spongobia TAU-MAC 1115]